MKDGRREEDGDEDRGGGGGVETSVAMNCLGEERKMTTWVWKNRTPADDGWTDGRTDGRGRPVAESDSTGSGRQKERSDESGKVLVHESEKDARSSQFVRKIRNSIGTRWRPVSTTSPFCRPLFVHPTTSSSSHRPCFPSTVTQYKREATHERSQEFFRKVRLRSVPSHKRRTDGLSGPRQRE